MTKTLAPGVWIQPYRDAIHDRTEIPAQLDAFARAGVAGVLWHGFPTEGAGWVGPLMGEVRSRGMLVGAAEGLDTASRTAQQKGASLAALGACGIDMLTWDDESRMFDAAGSDAYVVEMGAAMGPQPCVVVDQPWPGKGHSDYPFTAQGRIVDVRAPQFYSEASKRYLGRRRYGVLWPQWSAYWMHLEADVFTPDARKPRIVTVEGYDTWSDVMPDLVSMFCTWPTVIAWCEPWPGAAFMRGFAARRFLQAHGFLAADCSDGGEVFEQQTDGSMIVRCAAVKRFQASAGLIDDGRAGHDTLAKIGV